MPHKIALNGFGRLGRLALMAQTLPLMPPGAKRVFEDGIESLKDVINEKDNRNASLRMYPDTNQQGVKLRPPGSVVTDAVVDTSDIPNPRYHDRTFPKDYYKKKKAKRRQQKQARRWNK